MPGKPNRRRLGLAAAAFLLHLTLPPLAQAQAWLPPQGEGSVSVGVQELYVPYHLRFDGSAGPKANGDIRIHSMAVDATYGVSEKLAIDLALPRYIASRYGGVKPEGPRDDGKYYATFQDLHLGLRYAIRQRGLALTPSVAVVLPSHGYETFGHVSPGRDLRELGLGFSAGRSLAPVLPETYVHAHYVYAIVEGVTHEGLDLSLNRSNTELEVGHLLTRALSIRGFGAWQHTYGGIEWTEENLALHHEIHDLAARAILFRLGGGAAYALNPSIEVFGAVLTTMSGRNTHKAGGVMFGTSWTFGRPGTTGPVSPALSPRIARPPSRRF